jgi:aminodeoxyfutalosine deaminase
MLHQFLETNSRSSLAPHAPYSVSDTLFGLLADEQPVLTTIHNQESEAEMLFFNEGGGPMNDLYRQLGLDISFFQAPKSSSFAAVWKYLAEMQQVLLVHNCFTGESDLQLIKLRERASQIHFCVCANANLYIGNPLPNLPLLLQSGMNTCLGTDSLASNHELSIWGEIQTLATHFPEISIEQWLSLATLNGARALQVDDLLGSFEKGKQPGVVLIDENNQVQRLI